MKVCKGCGISKDITMYYKNKGMADGYLNKCKDCIKEYQVINKESIDIARKERYNKNIDFYKSKSRERYINNKEKYKFLRKRWKDNNIEKYREYQIEYLKQYYKLNKEKYNNYVKNRRCNEINRFSNYVSSSIRRNFKNLGYKKCKKTNQILGCSILEFRKYIESKFEPWMNWENHGLYNGEFNYGWDIDHIIPISSAKSIDDVIRLNHYTNLQPLCSYVNRVIKKDKM